MRCFLMLTFAFPCLSGTLPAADTVVSYDGQTSRGTVLRLKEGRLEVLADGEKEPARVALGNLSSVKFVPPPLDPEKFGSMLIVDNDGLHPPAEKSGKIKLRKGLHVFTLLYIQGTQGATLDLKWAGPGIKKQKIPRNRLSKWKSTADEVTYSAGLDEEGFRLPDTIDEKISAIGYKLFEWSQTEAVTEVGDLRNIALKKYGTMPEIGTNFPHTPTNFGAMIYGMLDVPRDGEYTFFLNSDDGSQLHIGKIPPISQPSIRAPTADQWLFQLTEDAQLNLPLDGWDEQGVRCTMKFGAREEELIIPPTYLREIWNRKYVDKPDALDRSGEPEDVDTVYAANAEGQIQRVTGTVTGIADNALKFDFQGQERTIALERVAAVVMRKHDAAAPASHKRVRLLFDLCGPDQLVGRLMDLTSGRAVIELPWGQELSLSRNHLYRITVLNGRMQSLQDLAPAEVVQTPFLDHILHWQAGKSLTGGRLQIGETTYPKGLCLHSRTELTWNLAGEYDRFQCDLGLQHPEGDAGNAAVRITADGAELFVADEVTAGDAAQSLDLDLSGKNQLTLEIDFGRNMHIGDHVVFGNARLLRPELTP